jgi:cation diffusion facilitator CzcD-associated flavoprotein CzcO
MSGDPQSAPHSSRLRVRIIGAGVSGIVAAAKVRELGIHDFVIYEKADEIGGTWRENTYPGIACDVPSHVYSFSFAPNPHWSRKFSPGSEIKNYLEDVARKFDITPQIRFAQEVTKLEFLNNEWHIETSSGDQDTADVVIAASGVLHHPNVPAFPGLEAFEGSLFHSARWDHDVAIDQRRVGLVGTGSTAVQILSAIGRRTKHLTLFQRTPQWILPLDDEPYSVEERTRFSVDERALREIREELSRRFAGGISDAVVDADSRLMKKIERNCHQYLEDAVVDPKLRERLRPDYRPACKRLVFSSDFYHVVQEPNVEVETSGIDRIEPRGVRTDDGRLHELDVVVLATGFKVDRFVRPVEVTGQSGRRLDDVWAERPSAYLAVSVPDFPNLFFLNGPTGPIGNFSLIEVSELQMGFIAQLIEQVNSGRVRAMSASTDAMIRYDAERTAAAAHTIWATGCRSWYLDDRGVPTAWPWRFDQFRDAMRKPRLEDFELIK